MFDDRPSSHLSGVGHDSQFASESNLHETSTQFRSTYDTKPDAGFSSSRPARQIQSHSQLYRLSDFYFEYSPDSTAQYPHLLSAELSSDPESDPEDSDSSDKTITIWSPQAPNFATPGQQSE
jgi:hypothetical protein